MKGFLSQSQIWCLVDNLYFDIFVFVCEFTVCCFCFESSIILCLRSKIAINIFVSTWSKILRQTFDGCVWQNVEDIVVVSPTYAKRRPRRMVESNSRRLIRRFSNLHVHFFHRCETVAVSVIGSNRRNGGRPLLGAL